MEADGLWKTFNIPSFVSDQILADALQLKHLKSIEAAGILVDLCEFSEDYITNWMLPLALWISSHCQDSTRSIVGIAAPAGSGKTVFSELLKLCINAAMGSEVCSIMGMDAYHRLNEDLERNGLKSQKGAPITFDAEAFVSDLERIKTQRDLFLPVYDRKLHDPRPNAVHLASQCRVVIVEGLFILYDQPPFDKVSQKLDLSIYLEIDPTECQRRVVERKVLGGRSREDAVAHYQNIDHSNHLLIEKGKHRANLILHLEDGIITQVQMNR
eukprot:TRINITY_DN19591_c0_g1_i1.p1 TRINITY_DN19591_c0_g1~~TRINITY_DN19591_c0_g1_i1.p1  ORF type:complete len:270 (+),score=44.05 TRINITY_DN19591_c0_g1_i1:6-815(+)